MSPEFLSLLQEYERTLKIDLDDLQIMINRKKMEFLKVKTAILNMEGSLESIAAVTIDCVNGDWDESDS